MIKRVEAPKPCKRRPNPAKGRGRLYSFDHMCLLWSYFVPFVYYL
jgi:hypothetical protein